MSRINIPVPPESILLVRLTARGDVVFASSVIGALRKAYPDARISWFGEAHTMGLIEHHPELHRAFSWNRIRLKRLPGTVRLLAQAKEVARLVRDLRSEKFDLAIDMQGFLRSSLIVFLSGARTRIVMRPKEGSHLLANHVVDRNRDQGDSGVILSHYRYLAEELGLETEDFRMEVPLTPEDRRFAERVVQEHGLEEGYAVALPHTTRPQKHWPEGRWAILMDRLKRDFGLSTVTLGGPGDLEADSRIRGEASSKHVSLVGKTSLREAAAVIENASLVIGVDTGLTHVGIAFDRPTIGLFGANVPYTETSSDRSRILVHWLECVPCHGNPTCDGDYTCLRLITVEEVLGVARDLLP